mgnify:CR=1 FL=1
MDQYVTPSLRRVRWCEDGWGRPGLEKTRAAGALRLAALKRLRHARRPDGHLFVADLAVPEAGDSGCPREIAVETFLPDAEPVLRQTVSWFGKPASRLPEAAWYSFVPAVLADGRLEMDKMGQAVSPDVDSGSRLPDFSPVLSRGLKSVIVRR